MNIGWIKVSTGLFDDPKIKSILHRENGEKYVLFFVQLLTLAGKENNGGVFFICENVPYTVSDFAAACECDEDFVKNAFELFQHYKMIAYEGNVVCICNWDKHQSEDKLAAERAKAAERQKRRRENQKIRANADSFSVDESVSEALQERDKSVTVTEMSHDKSVTEALQERDCHGTERESEEEAELYNINSKRESHEDIECRTPSLDEVKKEHAKQKYSFDCELFYDKMTAVGWKNNGVPVEDWRALMRVWEKREKSFHRGDKSRASPPSASEASYNLSEYEKKAVGLKYQRSG